MAQRRAQHRAPQSHSNGMTLFSATSSHWPLVAAALTHFPTEQVKCLPAGNQLKCTTREILHGL